MLKQVESKLSAGGVADRVQVLQANACELPDDPVRFAPGSFHSVYSCQVFHHLPVEQKDGKRDLVGTRRACQEAFRMLRKGGAFVINLSTHEQVMKGNWWSRLIPAAAKRFASSVPFFDDLVEICGEAGFDVAKVGVFADLHGKLQKVDQYNRLDAPLDPKFRATDSMWALTTPDEISAMESEVRAMMKEGTWEKQVEEWKADGEQVGQSVTYIFYKPTTH
jgi:SAM-dependent methyltransferase